MFDDLLFQIQSGHDIPHDHQGTAMLQVWLMTGDFPPEEQWVFTFLIVKHFYLEVLQAANMEYFQYISL